MEALANEGVGVLQQLRGQDDDASRPVPDLLILHLRQLDQDLFWVVACGGGGESCRKGREGQFQPNETLGKRFGLTLAAGCSTSSCFKMVAPSFVIVTSPMLSTNIWESVPRTRGGKKKKARGRVNCCVEREQGQRGRDLARSRPLGAPLGTGPSV